MFRIIGFGLATALTVTGVTGIGALILHDFSEAIDGLRSGTFAQVSTSAVEDLLDGVDDITLFIQTPVEGTDLQISTGAAFSSAAAIAAREPKNLWCYVNYGDGSLHTRITLGRRKASGKPDYDDLNDLPDAAFAELGLSRARLGRLARSHCKFAGFDPTKASS